MSVFDDRNDRVSRDLPPVDDTPTVAEPIADAILQRVPERVGPYRILRQLGRGGVGHVYLAEQEEPVRRKVALKLILAGAAGEDILRRFESERQAMARLNHPCIAQIFDAGTAGGRIPFIAMEYVDGKPLTTAARELRLEEKLRLFLRVCDGVQHAHQKGILHRDLKPSNVLVTDLDGEPTPKIIDFGLAKAVGFALTDDPMHTRANLVVGTPAYMAPEQLTVDGGGADTRSDVYALGVLLYQILAGDPPFDPTSLSRTSILEMARVLQEDVPDLPSRRLAERIAGTGNEAALPVDAEATRKALESDLDWVVFKALDKDPERRYRSPRKLADDLRRFLDGEPVEAHQPTIRYRAGKYVHKHRWLIAGTTFALLAILATFAWGWQNSRMEAQRANREAETAERVSDFLVDLFQVSHPDQSKGENVTARELLDRGAERIEQELADEPLVQARLLDTMAEVYIQLGLYPRAQEMLTRAVRLHESTPGDELALALSLENLAWIDFLEGRNKQAVPNLERSMELREQVLGAEDPLVGESLNNLAAVYRELTEYDSAAELYRRAIELLEKEAGSGDARVAYPLSNLATVLDDQGRFEEAEPLHLRALEIREQRLGRDDPETAISYGDVGWFYYLTEDFDRAGVFTRKALVIEQRVYDEEHPRLAMTLHNLGLIELKLGRLDEAEDYVKQALAIRKKRLRPGHHNLGWCYEALGRIEQARGNLDAARVYVQQALDIFQQSRGPDHPDTVAAQELLSSLDGSTSPRA